MGIMDRKEQTGILTRGVSGVVRPTNFSKQVMM
jgi:hypothetical protein